MTAPFPSLILAEKSGSTDWIIYNNPDRLNAECYASEDYAEGRKAFMEKRKARFKGR